MASKNIPKLLGEGIDKDILNKVMVIVKNNPYIIMVKNEKSVPNGPHTFRFSANISYDFEVSSSF